MFTLLLCLFLCARARRFTHGVPRAMRLLLTLLSVFRQTLAVDFLTLLLEGGDLNLRLWFSLFEHFKGGSSYSSSSSCSSYCHPNFRVCHHQNRYYKHRRHHHGCNLQFRFLIHYLQKNVSTFGSNNLFKCFHV